MRSNRERLKELMDAVGQAFDADAVAGWQDAEGDGLKSIYRAMTEELKSDASVSRHDRRMRIHEEIAFLHAELQALRDPCPCGASPLKYSVVCKPCQDRQSREREHARYDAAKKVPLAEYDQAYLVNVDSFVDVESVQEALDENELNEDGVPIDNNGDAIASWYYAVKTVPPPRIDAVDVISIAIEEKWGEDFADHYREDSEGLQKLLDGWIAGRGGTEFYAEDSSRIVVVLP